MLSQINDMSGKKATILVPNYKTEDITKICLRLLRKHTRPDLADVVVIDNNSADGSLDYLRKIDWIKLIEREPVKGETGVQAHARALDLALEEVKTPYVVSIHTDTFVRRDDWLETLLDEFDRPAVAGVGSWKLESKSRIRQFGIRLEQSWKFIFHKLFGYSGYKPNRLNFDARYLRSHCAVYRKDIIDKLNTHFADGDTTAGREMHFKMRAAHFEMKFLSSDFLSHYLVHLNHATSVLNPELRRTAETNEKEYRKIMKQLETLDAQKILADDSLDL